MKPTLGLTGVTVNAMALIAPGAFLWITFVVQAGYSFPAGMSMWAGILAALALAFATAVSYSELNKLYPGAGSSYLFAEQAFLNHSMHKPPDDKTIATLPHNIWYAAGMSSNAYLAAMPNGLALVTLISNFGIFISYGLTNLLCMVAYQEHHEFHGVKHMLIPLFGATANLVCMAFYIIGPIEGLGSVKERLMAVGVAALWGLYGAFLFHSQLEKTRQRDRVGENCLEKLSRSRDGKGGGPR
jgi:amino acid transporter